ncbi:MAG: sulfurtransferase-like selenium metabolism protein YedF [Bacteroidales bacterium]|nr:sulfurtransferase-like selenium metabolism protein YedF [Bacteroidales bacterium]
MIIVDTCGQKCPAPLIATRRALREAGSEEVIEVITDNLTSYNNLSRFLTDNYTDFSVSEEKGKWTLRITRRSETGSFTKPQDYCSTSPDTFPKGDFIIVFSSDRMGEGADELGHLLAGNFIKAVKDLDLLPEKIIFYNKGVILVSEESPVVENLKDLEKMGVELLVCATCVNYYKLEGKTTTGILSNMFVIAQAMASAGKIIRP